MRDEAAQGPRMVVGCQSGAPAALDATGLRHVAYPIVHSGAPPSTAVPTNVTISVTTPQQGARSSFSIFMASMTTQTLTLFDHIAHRDQRGYNLTGHGGHHSVPSPGAVRAAARLP